MFRTRAATVDKDYSYNFLYINAASQPNLERLSFFAIFKAIITMAVERLQAP